MYQWDVMVICPPVDEVQGAGCYGLIYMYDCVTTTVVLSNSSFGTCSQHVAADVAPLQRAKRRHNHGGAIHEQGYPALAQVLASKFYVHAWLVPSLTATLVQAVVWWCTAWLAQACNSRSLYAAGSC
jgi:hypothetical protein